MGKIYCLFVCLLILFTFRSSAQVTVKGNVYDASKLYSVPNVMVKSTSGASDVTDSAGAYKIQVAKSDSIYFTYNGKSTLRFPVKDIKDYSAFDISIQAKVQQKYKLLNPVTIYTPNYQLDSLENRQEYAKIFGDDRQGFHSTYDPGGAAGLDVDALIGMFQFRKNKERQAFRNRLLQQEQDNYVDYRFSSKTITRVTGLTGDSLETYKKLYRPSYYFTSTSTLTQFYQYILETAYAFRKNETPSNKNFLN